MLVCCEAILKEKKRSLYRQNSVLGFFNSSSGFHASPPVLLYIGNVVEDDPHIVLVEVPSPGIVTIHCIFFKICLEYIFSLGQYKLSEATLLSLTLRLGEIYLDLKLLG